MTITRPRRTHATLLRIAVAATAGATVLALAGCTQSIEGDPEPERTESPSSAATPSGTPGATPGTGAKAPRTRVSATVASGMEVPWGVAMLPDGNALVTERDSGRVLLVEIAGPGERGSVREVSRLAGGSGLEGGLLGIAVRPREPATELGQADVFVVQTTESDNRVLRGLWDGRRVTNWKPVLTGIPRGEIHDGGRIAFGPDGFLYVATGDAGFPDLAQDRGSLAGKILRITVDGEPAPGNPFETAVWSYGHRNVQGLAWDDDGQLWATEFGQNTSDELNRIVTGGNHGWPLAEGDDGASTSPAGDELVGPVLTWPTDEASPSGLAYAGGRLWVAGLRGERLWEVDLSQMNTAGAEITAKARLTGKFGRLRTVVAVPHTDAVSDSDRLWVTTSNRDGRGEPADLDDRILELTIGR